MKKQLQNETNQCSGNLLKVLFLCLAFLGMNSNVFSQTVLLTEAFGTASSGNSTATSGSSTVWSVSNNFSASSTVYQAGGSVRLGSGSATGSLTSKTLNLSTDGGSFTVQFDVKGWSSVEGNIRVTATGLTAQTSTYTAKMGDTFETKTLSFTGGTANSTVKIETTAGRAFIDNLVITTVVPPTITPSVTSLTAFANTNVGAQSTSKSFTLSGARLTANLVVTAPTDYKVSKDNVTFTQSITYTPASGTVASTTAYVRFEPTSPILREGNVAFTSTGATTQNISVSGTGISTSPYFQSDALAGFGNVCDNTTSVARSFNLYGFNLTTANVMVGPLSNYTFSTSESGAYSAFLTLAPASGEIAQQVYVKFTPTAVQSYNGNIPVSGGGVASTYNVAVTGAGINTPGTVTTGSGSALASVSATISATSTAGCSAFTSYGFEYSTQNNFVNGTGNPAPASGISGGAFSTSLTGLQPNTTYYFKAYIVDASGTIHGAQQSFLTSNVSAPVAGGASSAPTTNSFTANWLAVPGATAYRLDVSTSTNFTPEMKATDLIFSEYLEGSSNNKYIEIYNGTGATVDLSNYQLRLFANGGSSPSSSQTLDGNLADGQTVVYRNNQSTVYTGTTIVSSTINHNGDDAFGLWKISTSQYVDIFGAIGSDPGVAWTSGTFSTLDKTLVRKPTVLSGVTISVVGFPTLATEWIQYDIDTVSNLGSHTMTTSPSTFVTGYENLLVPGGNTTSQAVSGLNENTNYHYRVRAVSGSNASANSNTVDVLTATTPTTLGGITQAAVCEGASATFLLTGLTPSNTFSLSYNINGGATQTITGLVSDASGHSSFPLTLTSVNNTQVLTVTYIQRNGVPAVAISANNTVALAVNANVTYYADTDGDGFGNAASSVVSCTGQPAGYVANNTDCDDTNVNIYRTGNFYVDADGDGYTVGALVPVCYGATTPVGYAATSLGSDCNDDDNTKHATFPFYVDGDGDTYGAGNQVAVCAVNATTAPEGHSVNNTDCNDAIKEINPGATEIPYDGIDNNCDGDFDEGFPLITTALASERCNSVLEKIYHSINANWRVVGSTGYRFKVVNTRTSEVQTIERQNHYFNLTQLAHYDYATKYEVSVELQRYGKWLGYYGTACEVTSPDLPKLDVCGGIVASKNSLVRSQVLLYVTNYRFKVTNFLSGESIIVSNGLQYFSFNQIPGYVPGALYRVQVSVKTTDDWSEFGSICTITAPGGSAPEIPSTKDADNVSGFNAVAYPNPFANGFNLDIATSISDNVNIKVYDMLGKLIEVREVSATDLKEQELGNSYPAGVYNIIVTQGENLKTVRVIKR